MFVECDNLPTDGWLQGCLCCDIVTGNTYKFVIGYLCMYNVSAYLCSRCITDSKNQRMVVKDAPDFIKHQLNQTHFPLFP